HFQSLSLLSFCSTHLLSRALHSFPTRRSSDLDLPVREKFCGEFQAELQCDRFNGGFVEGVPLVFCVLTHHNVLIYTKIPEHRISDRKSTRLNSSHVKISYAVFCLKKKKK